MIELLLGLALGLALGYALGEGLAHKRVLDRWLKYYERVGVGASPVLKQEPAVLKQEREAVEPAVLRRREKAEAVEQETKRLEDAVLKQKAKTEEAKQETAMDCVEKVLSAGCATSEQIAQYCSKWSRRTLENRLNSLARAGAVSYDPAADLWCPTQST